MSFVTKIIHLIVNVGRVKEEWKWVKIDDIWHLSI
jgi:hypothetical protein